LILERTLVPLLSDPSGNKPFFGMVVEQPDLSYEIKVVNVQVPQAVYVAPNTGSEFTQIPFTVVLAKQREGETPRVELRVNLIDNKLYNFIKNTNGALRTRVTLMILLQSSITDRELVATNEAQIKLYALEINMRMQEASVVLGYQVPLDTAAVKMTYTPDTAPGLF